MGNVLLQDMEVTQGAVVSLTITAVVLFVLPIAYVVLWKKHCGKRVSLAPLFIGAAGFLVSARVLELGVHMVCIVGDRAVDVCLCGLADSMERDII